MQKYYDDKHVWQSVINLGGISHEVYIEAQHLYEHGGMSREQVADWLEAQGL